MIRIQTKLENNQIVTTLTDQNTQKQFQFSAAVDTLERAANDLLEACRLARQQMGLGALVLPFGRRTN